jgi:hypothetical protein
MAFVATLPSRAGPAAGRQLKFNNFKEKKEKSEYQTKKEAVKVAPRQNHQESSPAAFR